MTNETKPLSRSTAELVARYATLLADSRNQMHHITRLMSLANQDSLGCRDCSRIVTLAEQLASTQDRMQNIIEQIIPADREVATNVLATLAADEELDHLIAMGNIALY